METIDLIFSEVNKYIDPSYLIAFMALTYAGKGWVNSAIEYFTNIKTKKHHFAVFLIGTIVALPFWFGFNHDKMKLFMTYCIGTAMHSHIISYVIDKFRKPKP